MMVIIGICTYLFSDDCPRGNYLDLKKNHAMATRPHRDLYLDFMAVVRLPATWLLAFQYACCFGVEIQVHNVLSLYYYDDFKIDGCDVETDEGACRLLSQTKASLISSCFGLMCIFARAVGGYLSDVANQHFDMKGRIAIQLAMLSGEAVFLFIFSRAGTGSTYGIVPYVSPRHTGVTSGIVGAGGNMGGLAWGFLFKGVGSRALSFEYLSFITAGAALTCGGMRIDGESNLWTREFPMNHHNF
ncbi:High-affinity nitrate transporter 2.1 [Phytophthora pseudosyringae]|uniref:High-affinity nitrate transporter 2.1 n=1 Tax=Phytophthora pseudosyringae TaxID=221518 RepID=A0A8T1VH92_9STRA|nr:High-affinity nitrate transporter 2.1 [Phytophthora pseudosyringae]